MIRSFNYSIQNPIENARKRTEKCRFRNNRITGTTSFLCYGKRVVKCGLIPNLVLLKVVSPNQVIQEQETSWYTLESITRLTEDQGFNQSWTNFKNFNKTSKTTHRCLTLFLQHQCKLETNLIYWTWVNVKWEVVQKFTVFTVQDVFRCLAENTDRKLFKVLSITRKIKVQWSRADA